MYNIDTNNVVFVERVDEIICDVDTRFNSLKFDVERNSEFEVAVFDNDVRDVLLLNNVCFSMNKISVFSNALWVRTKALHILYHLFFGRRKNEMDAYNFDSNLKNILGENL